MEIIDRTDPRVFKPLIDSVLIELAVINDSDKELVISALGDLSAEGMISFWYLKKAVSKTSQWSYHGKVEKVLNDYGNWGANIFEASAELPFLVNEDEGYQDDRGADTWPIYLENYPEEAHEALSQDFYLDGGGGDVLGVWKNGAIFKIFIATPHSFEIIADDPIEWIVKTKLFVVDKLKSES
jgi:hypothetical protein